MENENNLPTHFKSFRNVYRDAYIFGLPSEMFGIFLGLTFLVGFIMLLVQSLVFTIVGAVFLGGAYGVIYMLIAKYGRHFFKKLLAYYTDQNFAIVRKNRLIKNILKK